MKQPLSVIIITQNEATRIRGCLESAAWADEIIVVDAESTDDTVAICREFTDRIFIRPWPGFAKQKQFALDQCRHSWVLSLDADERVRPALTEEIIRILAAPPSVDGYRIGRRSHFFQVWVRHCGWYPGYQVRLFDKIKTHVSQSRVHEGFLVDGTVATLSADLDHFSHPSLENSLAKLNRYSSLEALDRLGRRRVYWYDFILHPWSAFIKKYLLQQGFRDGMAGLLLCWISALLKMVMYMKIWKLQRSDAQWVARAREKHW